MVLTSRSRTMKDSLLKYETKYQQNDRHNKLNKYRNKYCSKLFADKRERLAY